MTQTVRSRGSRRRPAVVAHRGASGSAPENTLAAFRRALDLGVEAVELDVHRTADGQVVVIHDPTVDRTTNGTGVVSAMDLAQVQGLDAGAWRGPEFAGERIPTLSEVCALCRGRAFLFVEVKPAGIEEAVLEALAASGTEGQAIVISFSRDTVARLKELRSDLALGLLTARAEDLAVAADLGVEVLCLHYLAATPEIARALHESDRALMVWTVNEPAAARAMAELGADFITTDLPEQVLEALV